jgi:hypothetical protein
MTRDQDAPDTTAYDGFAEDADDLDQRARTAPGAVRADDVEPYVALQYVARLFKGVALVVVVALTAEIIVGLALDWTAAIIPLLNELVRGIVLAAILWGAGDLTLLIIDVGHDVRAARILLGRLSARSAPGNGPRQERSEPRA